MIKIFPPEKLNSFNQRRNKKNLRSQNICRQTGWRWQAVLPTHTIFFLFYSVQMNLCSFWVFFSSEHPLPYSCHLL